MELANKPIVLAGETAEDGEGWNVMKMEFSKS
jgi:hypothetical protein